MSRMKFVKRKRRRPDGSYEWILDTPDWYERELRWKEIERKYLDPALNRMIDAGEHVSRYMHHRVMPRIGSMLSRFIDSTLGSLYERVTEVKVKDTPEARAVEKFMNFVMGPFSRLMEIVIRILIYGMVAFTVVGGAFYFFYLFIHWIME